MHFCELNFAQTFSWNQSVLSNEVKDFLLKEKEGIDFGRLYSHGWKAILWVQVCIAVFLY